MNLSYQTVKRLLHLGFWVGFVLIASLLVGNFAGFWPSLGRTMVMAIFHAILVYTNLWWLLPRYFDHKRYLTYAVGLVVVLGLVVMARMWTDDWMLYQINNPDSPLLPFKGTTFHVLSTLFSSIIMLAVFTPLHWLDDWYQKKQAQQQLENQRLEAELKFLKAQVNPHFLFNTLNNIYALAFTDSPQAAPMILQLSDMMRYMLYESEAAEVPLSKEIAYLRNFISLQQLKTEEPQAISFEVGGEVSGVKIAPLLLVPLFENAFKHGNLEEDGWLKAKLSLEANTLTFSIQNTIGQNHQKDEVGGIGLQNLQQRLQLLYPDRHDIQVKSSDGIFEVLIRIKQAIPQ